MVRQIPLPALMQEVPRREFAVGNVGVGGTESHETLPVPWDMLIIHGYGKYLQGYGKYPCGRVSNGAGGAV